MSDRRRHRTKIAARFITTLVAAALVTSGCTPSQGATISPIVGSTPSTQPGSLSSPTPSVPASVASEPAPDTHEPWIAYQWARAGGDGVYLMRPDGTDAHELIPGADHNSYHPDWSPDGAQIAFDAETGGGNEVWVITADGTNAKATARRSTDCTISCGDVALPAWSPDGTEIAFVRFRLGASGLEAAVIEVQDIASGDRRVVYRAPSKTALNYPRWSPDGRSIVFEMTRYPDAQITTGTATGSAIAVIDATGEGAKPLILTDWSMYATYPDWRAGSNSIVFSTYDLGEFQATDEPSNLYTIKPDGTGLKTLTTFGKAEQRATQPTWTPDGAGIIFTLVGQQAGMDTPRQAAFLNDTGGGLIDNIGVAATHPRLRPVTP